MFQIEKIKLKKYSNNVWTSVEDLRNFQIAISSIWYLFRCLFNLSLEAGL